MRWALVWSAVSGLAGCYGGGAFHCETNDQCSGAGMQGVCQPDSFCSFPDAVCPTGQRYGTSSGPSSGQCVGGGPMDAPMEPLSTEPGIDAQECFGDKTAVCIHPPPAQPLALPAVIHTDTDCMMTVPQTGGTDLCVFYGATITTPDDVRATGNRPLVLVASDSISVDHTIDVSSQQGGTPGAAANASQCNAPTAAKNGGGGGGGGAGGSFVGKGGNGGQGDQNGGKNNGGNAGDASPPALIRGGCPGGVGGDGTGNGGAFGNGGGAVYLIALNQITVAGNIFASGAAGAGGGVEAGAGGAGSGGMVGFDATTITDTGVVAANGGGGGGGGSTSMGPGAAGGEGTTTNYNQRAPAGAGTGTNKGDGGAGTDDATQNADNGHNADGGAGAGGGGIGIVWKHGAFTGAKVSPTPTDR
ncbi:MAG TPA: hypothetical protein VGO00_02210 [Kofleriaceae bacterium]|nr:hypothetical protein [Kofleriaceae bacterium]